MKLFYLLLFCLLNVTTVVNAQRVFPVATKPSFAGKDTTLKGSYVELNEPFVAKDPYGKATVLFHVLDKDNRSYSGYTFKLEYKDFNTGTWKTYLNYEAIVAYNDGEERVMPIAHQLPNGYYRAWAQCQKTNKIGIEPFIVDITKDNPEPVQFTLHIPQQQTWLPPY